MDISELARYGVGAATAYSFCKYVIAPFIENVREQKRISKSREMSAVYERCYNQTLEARKQTVLSLGKDGVLTGEIVQSIERLLPLPEDCYLF